MYIYMSSSSDGKFHVLKMYKKPFKFNFTDFIIIELKCIANI